MLNFNKTKKQLKVFIKENNLKLKYELKDLNDWGLALYCNSHECYLGLFKSDKWENAILNYEKYYAKDNFNQLSLF